jgi:hypothetical protein
MRIKRLFLTGVAALFLATGIAHANDKLPEYMLGRWCSSPFVGTKTQEVYFRPDQNSPGKTTCSDLTDGINIDQKGYVDESPADNADDCVFDNINRRNNDTYLIHARCKEGDSNKPSFEGDEEFQLVNGLLFKKRMRTAHAQHTKDDCAVVLKTPDGFLALRERPTTKSRMKFKLTQGDFLYTKECDDLVCGGRKGWTHIQQPMGVEYNVGWVYNKYIQKFDCPDSPEPKQDIPSTGKERK